MAMTPGKNPITDLIIGMGSMAEITHTFYTSMIKSGASVPEATEAMKAFVTAFWMDSMTNARKKQAQEERQDG